MRKLFKFLREPYRQASIWSNLELSLFVSILTCVNIYVGVPWYIAIPVGDIGYIAGWYLIRWIKQVH